LALVGCGDDGVPGGNGGTGGTAGTGGTGGTAGTGGAAGTGGTGGQMDWPPNAAVYIEDNGIFHADCETDEDCAMALGYFHARDRFVQMDLQRRLSTGRLSEIVQKALVELVPGLLDKLINEAATNRARYSTRDGRPGEEALLDSVDPELLPILEAYAVGVNQWIDDVRNGVEGAEWPVEFQSGLLDYPPEKALPWKPSDTFATFFTLVGSLTNDEGTQLRASAARDTFPDDEEGNHRYLDHWSLEPIKKSPIMEPGTYPFPIASNASTVSDPVRADLFRRAQGAFASLRAQAKASDALREIFPQTGIINGDIGSNNWVMGGSKTANGRTLLSNDPHLGLSQPSVWYIAHMDAKTHGSGSLHIAGLTLAGIPACVVGQNEDVAWGVTNTGLDFTDVYVEELVKNGEGEPIGVMFKGEVVPFTRVNFELPFNDGTSVTRELLFVPHHGMVRSIDVDNNVALTLRWTMNDMDTDPNFILPLSRATTVEEARVGLENVTSLGQNWVVIDNQGNFGWFPYNRIPKRTWAINLDMSDRTQPFPWLPLDGRGDFEWEEYFDLSELPQLYNRANGWIATANSDHTGAAFDGNPTNDGFAPQQTDNIAAGYRTARIVELIGETDGHTPETNAALISDVLSMIGRDMIPEILAIANDTTLTDEAQKVVNALTSWTFTCPTGLDGHDPVLSPLASVAEVEESSGCTAWHAAIRAIDDALARDESTKSFPSFVTYFSIMDPSRLRAGDVYWDDVRTEGVTETKYDIIAAALDTAGSGLVSEYGSDETQWPWGRKHGFRLSSLLADLSAAFFSSYNNPPGTEDFFANDGGLFTVDVANPARNGQHSSGASTRFQCEGLDTVKCTVQLPGGQSALPSSPNYDDLLELYLDNVPTDLIFDTDQAQGAAAQTFDWRQ